MSQITAPNEITADRSQKAKLEDLIDELDDWCAALRSAKAGYAQLMAALAAFQTNQPDKLRFAEMPIMFAASANGRDRVDVVFKLGEVAPEHIGHVLTPLINLFAQKIHAAIQEIKIRVEDIPVLLFPLDNQAQASS